MPIYVEDKKIILEEYFAAKMKLIRENIKWDSAKDLRRLEVVCFYKTSAFCKVTSKIKKKMKHGEFRVSNTIDEKGYKFELQDAFMLYYKFYHLDKLDDEFL